ncbi:MAG: sulfite exporter TauE/SafE family protein [Microbacterium sp.]
MTTPETAAAAWRGPREAVTFFVIGLIAGLLSGMFGVGGGVVIVPALVFALRMAQKRASNTSLAVIVPVAVVGIVSYAVSGSLDASAWVPGLILGAGGVVGSIIGAKLLPLIPVAVLQLGFSGLMVIAIISLFLVIPTRGEPFPLTAWASVGLVFLGLAVGILSKLLGVGGGIIIVPVLLLIFGVSDLLARVTSLIAMVPTAIAGTVDSVRSGKADFVGAAFLALGAILTPPVGAWLAQTVDPFTGNVLFAIFLAGISIQLFLRGLKGLRAKEAGA